MQLVKPINYLGIPTMHSQVNLLNHGDIILYFIYLYVIYIIYYIFRVQSNKFDNIYNKIGNFKRIEHVFIKLSNYFDKKH